MFRFPDYSGIWVRINWLADTRKLEGGRGKGGGGRGQGEEGAGRYIGGGGGKAFDGIGMEVEVGFWGGGV